MEKIKTEEKQKVYHRSNHQGWGTPPEFIEFLSDVKDMTFDLDAAASSDNKKAPVFFSEVEDGLNQDWFGDVWLNPPFGSALRSWMEKAAYEVNIGNANSVTALVPARPDTKWFHEVVMKKAYLIYFIKGRFNFISEERNCPGANSPFPSMLVVFRRHLFHAQTAGLTTLEVPKDARGF